MGNIDNLHTEHNSPIYRRPIEYLALSQLIYVAAQTAADI
jgi:hypothetical protein